MSPRSIVIGGPTAVGKTDAAVELAESVGGEIVNADSVQIYRGFDLGSAKPTPEDQARVRHHLVDICEPTEVYSAARFVADADAAIADIAERGLVPIVCGGTGLYLRSLLGGLFEAPGDPAVRDALRARIDAEGTPALHAELREVDPDAAGRISPNDGVRVARALEVYRVSGRPISALQREHGLADDRYPALRVTVTRRRSELDRRIAVRTRAMLAAGFVDEVRGLLSAGVDPGCPAMRTVGYREVVAHLSGELDADALADRIRIATRRFSKRQLTWFRGQWRSRWLDLADPASRAGLEMAARAHVAGERVPDLGTADDAHLRDL